MQKTETSEQDFSFVEFINFLNEENERIAKEEKMGLENGEAKNKEKNVSYDEEGNKIII